MTQGPTAPEEIADAQRNVQRLLGRCMLRLQQYERLLKAVLTLHELSGPTDELESRQAAKAEKHSDMTMGTLVRSLFESFVVTKGFERDLLPAGQNATNCVSMAFCGRVSMTQERAAETRDALQELVELRNELVHHLIERFDLWSDDGCVLASNHLEGCYQRIDGHYGQLNHWVKSLGQARGVAADLVASKVFRDMLLDGIAPDGGVDWAASGIARALKEAACAVSGDGWARLDHAQAWIESRHPEQVPQKYGCRTWPQVLHESRLFDLENRMSDGKKVPWFRARS